MEFKHFSPIGQATPAKIIPNFTGGVDVFSPKKNQAHFEELVTDLGINQLRNVILKNTLKFFQTKDVPTNQRRQFGSSTIQTMPSVGTNMFGFPIFSNLIIKAGSYQDNHGNTIGTFGEIRLDAVIMEMERENNIVTTEIQGRNGTVIEYISSKSINVHVTGRILNKYPGVYPQNEVEELARALNSNRALQVTSWFLAMRGIYNLIIKKDSIKQEEGSQEFQKFEFDALADEPIELRLKKLNL